MLDQGPAAAGAPGPETRSLPVGAEIAIRFC
jgi:hypothetical protein